MLWYTVMSCSPSMLLFSQYLLSCVTVPHEALSYYAENVIVTDTIYYLYHLIPPLLCVCTVCVSPVSALDHDFTADRMMGVDNEW